MATANSKVPGYSMNHIRRFYCLSDPVYTEPVAKRGNSKGCTVYNARIETAARVLAFRLSLWYRVWHKETAAYWNARADRIQAVLGRMMEREHVRTFGRPGMPWEVYKVSGIGREEYSESFKRRARILSHSIGKMRDLARVHSRVARYYTDSAEPSRSTTPRERQYVRH